jgi:hypothetical protein
METRKFIKTYLPILQDLQNKVVSRDGFSMIIAAAKDHISVTLSAPTDDIDNPLEITHAYLWAFQCEDELRQCVISLEAFYANACMTTVTGVNYPLSMN